MDTEQLFYTQNGYDRADTGPLTTAMEDYLEMICRLTRSGGYTRISRWRASCMSSLRRPPKWPRCCVPEAI